MGKIIHLKDIQYCLRKAKQNKSLANFSDRDLITYFLYSALLDIKIKIPPEANSPYFDMNLEETNVALLESTNSSRIILYNKSSRIVIPHNFPKSFDAFYEIGESQPRPFFGLDTLVFLQNLDRNTKIQEKIFSRHSGESIKPLDRLRNAASFIESILETMNYSVVEIAHTPLDNYSALLSWIGYE